MENRLPLKLLAFGILGALLLSILFSFQAFIPYLYSGDEESFSWEFNTVPIFTRYILWALLLPIIFNLYQRVQSAVSKSYRSLFGLSLLLVFIALMHSALIWVLYIGYAIVFNEMQINEGLIEHVVRTVYAGSVSSGIELLLIVAGIAVWQFYEKGQQDKLAVVQLQKQLGEAQLTALRMQLNPHFLFNAFNTVSSLIDVAPDKAKDMLGDVSALMRDLLKQDRRHSTTLGEEQTFIQRYLSIEQMRFGDRLVANVEIPEDLKDSLVPNLILQPLVENCFKHAFSKKVGECHLTVSATEKDDRLTLLVKDNGESSQVTVPSLGIGLRNCQKRLAQMFGEDASLDFHHSNEGAIVKMMLPLQKLDF